MSKIPNKFEVREPGPLTDEGTEVEVIRRRGPNGDVWSLTTDELLSLYHTIGDYFVGRPSTLVTWPEEGNETL